MYISVSKFYLQHIMKKILYPTDASSASKNALFYALHIAKINEAEIIAFHFYDAPQAHIKMAETEIEQEAQNQGIDITIKHLSKNNQNRSIELVAKNEQVDVVVMATKGSSGENDVMLGAIISEVMTNTKALVLGIPESYKLSDGIKNITFTTRFREKDKKALNKCLKFADMLGAKVNCLYIKTPKSDISDSIIEQWKTLYADKNVTFHILESPEVKKTVLNYIEQNDSDLLAILTYKRNFLEELFRGSTTQKLSYYASVPVLAIHESDLK